MDYKKFLTIEVPERAKTLSMLHQPLWGRGEMNAHNMLEHLYTSVTASTIISQIDAPATSFQQDMKEKMLISPEPFPRMIENPLLKDGMPAYETPNIEAAKEKMLKKIMDFYRIYEAKPDAKHYHLFFGLLSFEELQHLHYKHFTHHFTQFGLIK